MNVYGVGWWECGEEKERKTVREAEMEERRSDKKSDRFSGGGGGGRWCLTEEIFSEEGYEIRIFYREIVL